MAGKGGQGGGSPLLVFQCQHCNSILGDSFSLVATDEELRTITLRGASSIDILEEQPRTYEEGKAAGSTFLTIKCKSCRTDVGRVFITTPRTLDNIRDLLSLDAQKIISYSLGSHEVLAAVPTAEPEVLPILDPRTSGAKIKHLETELLKVEHMVLLHSERLEQLEGAGRDLPSNGGEEEANEPGAEARDTDAQGLEDPKETPTQTGGGADNGRLDKPTLKRPGSRMDKEVVGNGKQGEIVGEPPSKRQTRKSSRHD